MSGWTLRDGSPVSCAEKLRTLNENEAELAQVLQDAFDDALLMGVDEAAMRQRLQALLDGLRSPIRSPAAG